MKYERLTERVGRGVCVKETSTNDNMSIWNAIERLCFGRKNNYAKL